MAKISVYSIGCSNDADIQLSDPTVSRIHAELVITAAGKYYLTGCASSGGTYTMQGNDKSAIKQAFVNQTDAAPIEKPADDEKTRLVGFKKSSAGAESTTVSESTVGWLAIVARPGLGNVVSIGYGVNTIGRGGSSRVNLDFSDKQISRSEHSIIAYDPKGRNFYIQYGSGENLTYLGDKPVLVPTELEDRARITLGNTSLMFISLCGDSFDWQDIEGGDANEQT